MPRIYLSPSTQQNNVGVSPFTNEEAEMNKIADALIPLLLKDGRFTIKRNTPDMDVYQIARDSNNFNSDIHVAIHSNAGGAEGTEVFAYGPKTSSERLARTLYNQIAPLSPGADRGVKYKSGLVEVGDIVGATACLIELGFHDNREDAAWLVNQPHAIALALYKGICDFYGYEYRGLTVVVPPMPIVEATVAIQPRKFAVDDGYLWVLCREPLMEQAKKDINKLGFACDRLNLAK